MAYEINVGTDKLFPNVAVGIKLPIVNTNKRLFPQSYSTLEQAISNLKNLILTKQGERLYQPLFGTNLQKIIFEQNTDVIKEKVKLEINSAVGFWLPYITINRLDVQLVVADLGYNEEHGIKISMYISVNKQKSETPITFLITSSTIEEIYVTS